MAQSEDINQSEDGKIRLLWEWCKKKKYRSYMTVKNMSEDKSHLENRDPKSVRMSFHPGYPSRMHHN